MFSQAKLLEEKLFITVGQRHQISDEDDIHERYSAELLLLI